ncbi:hypothetical protein D8O27_29735 [Burkholderia mallei]|nr:hypothetical protein BOC36_12010 [Burkholderia pseudomallei]PNW95349.1 hypothetical protein CF649_31705 [Burkholderia sp. 136(2017)]PNX11243.1 hypothetical protein CF650_31540 [Burkholderia sp. 129]PNX25659.1 hypothetical protein CF647_29760 [Burkholderia sp. 117]PNX32633.1 hypothetical protein CF648_31710 [Burkholderia sp. 137]RKN90110.1 hypothetical protein D8O31_29890 [Burkholderia mallei]
MGAATLGRSGGGRTRVVARGAGALGARALHDVVTAAAAAAARVGPAALAACTACAAYVASSDAQTKRRCPLVGHRLF